MTHHDRGGNPKTSGKRTNVRRAEQQAKLVEAYVRCNSLDEVAKELGYHNKSNVHRALQVALKARAKERAELADQALERHISRYEYLIGKHMDDADKCFNKGDTLGAARSTKAVLDLGERIERLTGLDQPQRHEITVTATVDDLDREIAELASKLTAKAKADGVDLDLPVTEAVIAHGKALDGGGAS